MPADTAWRIKTLTYAVQELGDKDARQPLQKLLVANQDKLPELLPQTDMAQLFDAVDTDEISPRIDVGAGRGRR